MPSLAQGFLLCGHSCTTVIKSTTFINFTKWEDSPMKLLSLQGSLRLHTVIGLCGRNWWTKQWARSFSSQSSGVSRERDRSVGQTSLGSHFICSSRMGSAKWIATRAGF